MQAKFEADAKAQADEIAALKAMLAQRNTDASAPEVAVPTAPEVAATPLPAPEVAQPAPKIDKAAKKKKQEALKKHELKRKQLNSRKSWRKPKRGKKKWPP